MSYLEAINILNETIDKLENVKIIDEYGRTKYWDSSNPMSVRRKNALQSIYQFLKNENLITSLSLLQNETYMDTVYVYIFVW